MAAAISIGISTCPNDTFAFAALLEGRVPAPELEFRLDDIEALNEALFRRELDVAKASFHAALHLAGDYCVLPVGAALGYGVGPLLLSATKLVAGSRPKPNDRVLCPGRWTTATLLYRLYCPQGREPEQVVFSEIMPALARGEADFGVVIHEGRFTYTDHGLHKVADLGELWETENQAPLPLGGLLALRELGPSRLQELTEAVRASLRAAREDPDSALPQMRRWAQELSDDALWEHVHLYVNDVTQVLGEEGRRALELLEARARDAGIYEGEASLLFT